MQDEKSRVEKRPAGQDPQYYFREQVDTYLDVGDTNHLEAAFW